MEIITTIFIWIAAAIICYAIAKKKGRNELIAVALGLLFSFLAVIYYLVSKGSDEYELQKAKDRVEKLKKK